MTRAPKRTIHSGKFANPPTKNDPRYYEWLTQQIVGKEISTFRGDARYGGDISGEALAALVDKTKHWTMKIEAGNISISLVDYLTVMHSLRAHVPPDHPALALYEYFHRRYPAAERARQA